MTTRQEVVDHWQSRLAEAERHENGDSRSGWMQTVYRRIYKFLLRCYGKASWSTQPQDRQADETHPLPGIDPHGGKPARTAGAIQSTLKRVHAANSDNATPAPPTQPVTVGKLDWVAAAEFRGPSASRIFMRSLRARHIPTRRLKRGNHHFVLVQRRDLDEAAAFHNVMRRCLSACDATQLQRFVRFVEIAAACSGFCLYGLICLAGWLIIIFVWIETATPMQFWLSIVGLGLVTSITWLVCWVTRQWWRRQTTTVH